MFLLGVVASRYIGVGSAGGHSTAVGARVSGGANALPVPPSCAGLRTAPTR